MRKAFIILLSILLVFTAISCNSTNTAYTADDSDADVDSSVAPQNPDNALSATENGYGTVVFVPNSASGSMPNQQVNAGMLTRLNKCTFTMTDCHFAGWNLDSSGEGDWLDDEEEVMLSDGEVLTLYAFFEPDSVTVTFNANGGTGDMPAQNVIVNQGFVLNANTFTAPPNTAFYGWDTKPDGSGYYYGDGAYISINEDLDLYAMWAPAN